jgi:hypothetical protein
MIHDELTLIGAQAIVDAFDIPGTVASCAPFGYGHINDTFAVTMQVDSDTERYILQRINERVFCDVNGMMENIIRVTDHLRAKLRDRPGSDPARETMTIMPTHDGNWVYRDASEDAWRMYLFINGAITYEIIESHHQAGEATKAFGVFQELLSDLPAPRLHDTIPDFHNTPKRFEHLVAAATNDSLNRAATCREDIDFALGLEGITATVTDGMRAGQIPERVTHNDTKINNVMFDKKTDCGICVIDLDTVMPGSVLYDFGDQIRTTIGDFQENERDLRKVSAGLDRYESMVAGYMGVARNFLVPREVDLLTDSGILITYEIGMRFLTDHIEGDTYFRIHRPGENLDRARTQFALVRDLRSKSDALKAIVERHRDA